MDTITYWKGEWVDGNPPLLAPRDHGFWLASVVFDGGRAIGGYGPDLDLHSQRVIRSARRMGLAPKETAEEIHELSKVGSRKFGPKAELYVRPMYWATASANGPINPDPETTQFCLCIYNSPMPPQAKGLKLGLCRTIRRPSPETAPTDLKGAALYPNSARGVREVVARGFDNGIVLDLNGNVAETCSSNIFLAKDGVVITPVANGTFLAGITRYRTMEVLRAGGVKVEERTVSVQDLMDADEMFTTGNAGKVQPVVQFEERALQAGPLGRKARDLYMDFVRSQPLG